MASNYWIKLYHEMLDDPKMGRLTDRQYRRVIELFLLTGDYEQDGFLPPLEDVAFRLRFPEGLQDDLDVLEKVGIISRNEKGTYYITKWQERQGAMTATERTQRFRQRQRKVNYYCNASETNCSIDKDKDKEGEKKEKDVDEEKKFSVNNYHILEDFSEVFKKFTQKEFEPIRFKKFLEFNASPFDMETAFNELLAKNLQLPKSPENAVSSTFSVVLRAKEKTIKNEMDVCQYTNGRYGKFIRNK